MRRFAVLLATGILYLVAVAPVAALKPDREPVPPLPLTFAAGEVCAFEVTIDTPGQKQTQTTFFDRFGNPRAVVTTGRGPLLVRNEDTGAEYLKRGGGRLSVGGDEGTFTLDGSGVIGLYFLPGDATPVGVGDGGLYAIAGSFHEELDLNTNIVTVFEYSGTAIDLCAAVAPD